MLRNIHSTPFLVQLAIRSSLIPKFDKPYLCPFYKYKRLRWKLSIRDTNACTSEYMYLKVRGVREKLRRLFIILLIKSLDYLFFIIPGALTILVVIVIVIVGELGIYGFGHLSILVLHAGSRSRVLFTSG